MAPAFLSGGTTPKRNDTKWLIWCRILGLRQNQLGSAAAPENNPRKSDTIRTLKDKVLKTLQ
jgi:hypothetical protein